MVVGLSFGFVNMMDKYEMDYYQQQTQLSVSIFRDQLWVD
jgi:hypothetical protein